LLCRGYGITELAATGGGSAMLKVSPLVLPDSAQVRLARMYPAATYRATTSTVQVPIPRAGSGVGAPRIRDLELVAWAADLVLALHGRAGGEVDITTFSAQRQGSR
jgi:transcription-repair coupling factor (superfamily II helicase)